MPLAVRASYTSASPSVHSKTLINFYISMVLFEHCRSETDVVVWLVII